MAQSSRQHAGATKWSSRTSCLFAVAITNCLMVLSLQHVVAELPTAVTTRGSPDTKGSQVYGDASDSSPWAKWARNWPGAEEPPSKLKYVALIAERHSGSTWMTRLLKHYFKGQGIVVEPSLCNWKHWFQNRIHTEMESGERSCRPTRPCRPCLHGNHTLVVAMWRNPYDWTAAMSENPHHSKYHRGLAGNLTTFLTRRWMVPEQRERLFRKIATKSFESNGGCVDNFMPWEVVPCESKRSAIYEVDQNGVAYNNIYELRKAKIKDFAAVREWAPMYEAIRYEDMLDLDYLNKWFSSLESKYGLVGSPSKLPTAEQSSWMKRRLEVMYYTNSTHCAPNCTMGVQLDALETMNELFDVELETSIGYHKIVPSC